MKNSFQFAAQSVETEAFIALEEERPFSSVDTKMIRYWGKNRKIINMMIDQIATLKA